MDLQIQQEQQAQALARVARQQQLDMALLRDQNEQLARQLRKIERAGKPKDTSFHQLPPPPDESWVTAKYLKEYETAWYYVCQNYPLLASQTYVRGFFDAMLERAQAQPNWVQTTVPYSWLRQFADAFVKEWGVPHARDVKPDTASYRDIASRGTPKMRAYIEKNRKEATK